MSDNTRTKIIDVKNDESGQSKRFPVLITGMENSETAQGKPFVRISITDGVTADTANYFDGTIETLEQIGIKEGAIVDVNLRYKPPFLNFEKPNQIALTADKTLKPEDFIRHPPVDVEQMFDEICALIKSSADDFGGKYTPLANLALQILNDHKEFYIFSSAAESVHHNLRGGLIYHSYRMVKAADALCKVYTRLDRELMICGAALHDIGKTVELKTSVTGEAEYTKYGHLFGHLFIGGNIIYNCSEKDNYNKEKVDLLVHMIVSHHGNKEWGAVAVPAIPEAFLLHYIDCIDVKVYIFEESDKVMKPGAIGDKYIKALDNKPYKPDFGE